MNAEKLAAILDGMEYPLDISPDLLAQAKAAGLVIVYGDSDDLMELEGALRDEFGCWEGGVALVDADGILSDWDDVKDDQADASRWLARKKSALSLEVIWDAEGYSWVCKTDIPHVCFDVKEDGEKYCRGIVFSVTDLPLVQVAS